MGYAGLRVAYIDRFSDQKEVNEFGAEVAVHNGIKVEMFSDHGKAVEWLTRE